MKLFKQFLPVLAAGAIMIAAVFGFTTYKQVSAAGSTAPVAVVQNANLATDLNRGKGPQGGQVGDQALASALGIDLTKLQEAYKTANAEALKQAVADGLITQSQADQFTQNDTGNGRGLPFLKNSTIDFDALLAKALGIDVAKLQAARTQAFNASIDSAVTAGNLIQAQADLQKGRYALENNAKVQAALKTAYEAAVKQAVTDGVITQAQADAVLKAQTGTDVRGFGLPGMGGHGGADMGGRGGRGGNPGNNSGAPNNNTTPKATPAPGTNS